MPAHRRALRTAAAAAVAAALLGSTALLGSSGALAAPGSPARSGAPAVAPTGIVPPRNPRRSLPPRPNFLGLTACRAAKDGIACDRDVLRAIGRARRVLEHMRGMSFSLTAYRRLSHVEQLFVTVDLERVARRLPPAVVLTRSLDKIAQAGANRDDDPPLGELPSRLPGGGRWIAAGGNWAGGWRSPLGANYAWMYDDGPGWGHRDNILGTFSTRSRCGGSSAELAMGAGYIGSGKQYGDSETELLLGVCGRTPTDAIFTWTRARKLLHVKS
jgi:hypothetical protein